MIRLFSPAKINLFFKIIGLRKDGYHNLQSFFQAINLGDDLTFSFSEKDSFHSEGSDFHWNENNFIFKAVLLFRKKTNLNDPLKIELIKRIPVHAGLGGGSSNIASTLWGLNELFNRPASTEDLQKWGAELGADVSFFFSSGSALCEGIGEIVHPMEMPNVHSKIWLIKPPYSISTVEAYTYSKKESKIQQDLQALLKSMYSKNPIHKNDLEEAAFLICPPLALLKDELIYMGYKNVFMTGSGSAFVCFGENSPNFKNPTQIYPIQYINRASNEWYTKDKHAEAKT